MPGEGPFDFSDTTVLKRKGVVQGESAATVLEPAADTPTRGPVTKADENRQLAELIGRLRGSYRSVQTNTVLVCTVLHGLSVNETDAMEAVIGS